MQIIAFVLLIFNLNPNSGTLEYDVMKKMLLFTSIFLVLLSSGQAQDQAIYLGCGQKPTAQFNDFQNVILDFKKNDYKYPPYVKLCDHTKWKSYSSNLAITGTTISDTLGNLIAAYDGLKCIALPYKDSSTFSDPSKILYNGEKEIPMGGVDRGYIQNSVFVPHPTNPKQFYLFTLQSGNKDTMSLLSILYDFNNPIKDPSSKKFNVISKVRTKIASAEFEKGGLLACQHPNGRDWWLILSMRDSLNHLSLHRFLIDNVDIKFDGVQYTNYPTILSNVFKNVEYRDNIRVLYSPDGKYMVRAQINYYPNMLYEIFPFNRCTGEIDEANVHRIRFTNKDENSDGGMAFSPDSKFLYLSTGSKLVQFDVENDWDTVTIARRIHPTGLCALGDCDLNGLFLAPDNRIYMMSYFKRSFSVIFEPNKKGLNCHFGIDTLPLPTQMCAKDFPNHAFYRMPKMDCKTSTIDPSEEYFIRLTPNPGSDLLRLLATGLPENAICMITDILGRAVSLTPCRSGDIIDTSQWKAGIYIYTVRIGNKLLKSGRWIKQ